MLVFTSALNLRERALAAQSTWMKDFLHAYLVGGYHYDPKLKMISLGSNVGEDYFSATPKQFLGLKALYEKFSDKKWFYITGCDAYVYAEPLCAMLNNFDATKPLYIGGNFLKRTVDGTEFFFPAGGCVFVLSNALVAKLLPHINFILDDLCKYELFYKDGACDAAMGYYLLKLFDIKPIWQAGFYQVQPYRYPGDYFYNANGDFVTEPLIADPIAFHTLTIRELYKLRYLFAKKKRHLLTTNAPPPRQVVSTARAHAN